jgi:hydroxyversicolorone monooxygenase
MIADLRRHIAWRTQGYEDNGVERDPAYTIPDIVYGSPTVRKVRVLSIGAGVSGILNAYLFQKFGQNVELQIYEKNHDIGGTWLENRYPGRLPSRTKCFENTPMC